MTDHTDSPERWVKTNAPDNEYLPPATPPRRPGQVLGQVDQLLDSEGSSTLKLAPEQRRMWWGRKDTPLRSRKVKLRSGGFRNETMTLTLDEYLSTTAAAGPQQRATMATNETNEPVTTTRLWARRWRHSLAKQKEAARRSLG
jgi:hypothetical protein